MTDAATPTEKYRVTRPVTTEECWWLNEDIPEGAVVQRFFGHTYGSIGDGIACCWDGGNPFFQMPYDALEPLERSDSGDR